MNWTFSHTGFGALWLSEEKTEEISGLRFFSALRLIFFLSALFLFQSGWEFKNFHPFPLNRLTRP